MKREGDIQGSSLVGLHLTSFPILEVYQKNRFGRKSFNYPSMLILQLFPGPDCCERCGHEYGYFPDKHLPETCGSEKKECDKDDRCCKGNERSLKYRGISFIFFFIFTHSRTERKKGFSRNIAQSTMKMSHIHVPTRTHFDCTPNSTCL